jgi:hypothetical protein
MAFGAQVVSPWIVGEDMGFRVFAHALYGFASTRGEAPSQTSAEWVVGGGIDILLMRVQVDYVRLHLDPLKRGNSRVFIGGVVPLCLRSCRGGEINLSGRPATRWSGGRGHRNGAEGRHGGGPRCVPSSGQSPSSAPGRTQGKVKTRGIVKNPTKKLGTWIGLVALGAALVAAAAGATWYFASSRTQTAGEIDLGALPSGVRRNTLNIVVITLDTTRADHIGAYGSTLVKTPALDRLAGEGTRFAQAMSSAPLTLPAHSSMFTGRFPPEHGVRDNGGFFLAPEQTTLAEMLKEKGFATGGFIAAFVLDGKWGINQGFDEYFDDFDISERRGRSIGNIQRPGNEVVDKALPWIDSVKDRRFFAWIHLYDPHTPYDPPEPQKSEYTSKPWSSPQRESRTHAPTNAPVA